MVFILPKGLGNPGGGFVIRLLLVLTLTIAESVFEASTLEAWYQLYKTGEGKYFIALMAAVDLAKLKMI